MPIFGQIGRRLLLWFLLIAIVPLTIVGVRGYVLARRAVIKEVFLHMEAVAGHKRTHIEEWLNERVADLNVIISDRCIEEFFSMSQSGVAKTSTIESFHSCLNAIGGFDLLYFLDSDGQVVHSTFDQSPFSAFQHPEQWIISHSGSDGTKMSPVGYDPSIGTMIFVGLKMVDEQRSTLGWIVARLPLSKALDHVLLDSTGLGQSGHAYLVDGDKVMITRSRHMDHPEPGTHKMSTAAIDSALSGNTGVGIYTGWNDRPALGAWTYIPTTKWALIAEMDQSEALLELDHLKRNWLIVFLITVVSILVIVAILARSISRPILNLTATAEKVSKGDLSARAGIERKDEIGVLGDTFDRMGEALTESQLSLKESYQKLIQTERKLVKSEKLAAIGEIVASVVHELRNPLSVVKMNLKIISRKQETDSPTSKNVLTAQDQVSKLERMLSEILDYAKPVELQVTAADLMGLIEETLTTLKEHIEENGIEVIQELDQDLPKIECDRDLMIQALTNLIQNSMDAMYSQDNSQLKITAATTTGMNPEMVIEISDNGGGLSEIQLERIFEPFFTTRKSGTGLGLPNAMKVIELHGGKLEILSTENEGTTAKITLPLGGTDV